ncbi:MULTISPECIES: acetyl-CoA C-acetyltransferase [unclassified Saccharopolyspora]|uniref:acetyl-CoA C-acetyltransferase n=1 Tax=unclassified Saccharopolyspora TaxID=2646250 RepID=UPI001CD4A412|nr:MULTISPECIES: acetyl-CoA C-acetyltransferase [unclassified Saccharopolyspora]MCA1189469.1 acetyl-CoA C-acetyltransferase [Saccharopolyspora sp. 6T]MCA1193757.1 acetyl-CoA C-acetyltransferase [Saccharopolyspora sp. 6V]MCA1227374.1 acetyl-CoA C-acetyltransferase [Saccharopolyspora sp. 6M]MCA1280403.1 acetyl-CoA C-acetyltransferase [Saccharopolyspora sp. 7B]
MTEAYIVDALRTPVGKRGGGLSGVHPADLSAHVLQALVRRTGADPGEVDDVVWGCVDAVGAQAGNIARTGWLAAGFPEHVPGVTIDRQCGSSQQAVHFAAQAVLSGTADVVVAGGVANMSAIPIGSALRAADGLDFPVAYGPDSGSHGWQRRYGDAEVTQFQGAELIARHWGVSRADMEEFALRSHRRAIAAIDEGRFDAELVPVAGVERDEGPRRDTGPEKLAALRPLRPDGLLTAGVSSQLSDGASALLVASERAVAAHGWRPRARVHHLSVRGDDPVLMLSAPIEATRHALRKAGLSASDLDVVEINEAFASVVLAWQREIDVDPAKVNPNGGAIALGHPLGATGTKLMATMLGELERTGGRYGLQTMCEGGGTANVTVLERLGD